MLVVPSVMMMGQSPPNMDIESMMRTGNRVALLFAYSGTVYILMAVCFVFLKHMVHNTLFILFLKPYTINVM